MHKRRYRFFDAVIQLESNSDTRLRAIDDYLCLPKTAEKSAADIDIHWLEAEADSVDQLIHLPADGEAHRHDRVLLLNRPIPYRIFIKDEMRWNDFEGYGRMLLDYERATAKIVMIKENGVEPFFANLVFCSNPIYSLLAKLGYFSIHAAAAQVNGYGVLFSANSGGGKSTAAYALLRKGCRVISDERVVLFRSKEYWAASITDVFKITKEARRSFFPELVGISEIFQFDEEIYFKGGSLSGLRSLYGFPVHHLMVMEKTGEPSTRIERIKPSQVIRDLFPVTINPFEPTQMTSKFHFLMDFLENIECCRILFGTDMDEFYRAVTSWVRQHEYCHHNGSRTTF